MLTKTSIKNPAMQKRIPTVVGLLVLVGALVVGLLFFGEGTGVFAPRATAETTPKNIRITNIKDGSFTVTFATEKATPSFVKYGEDESRLNSQASDDRDQLSGTVGEHRLHHITVRGLEPNTQYFFVLGTESRTEFDNEGQPFTITTPARPSGQMPDAVTIYGSVSNEGGMPAEGSIAYISAQDMGDLSALVKGSGSWAVPLSQALTSDGSDYARLDEEDFLSLLIQGPEASNRIQYQVQVGEAQPVTELIFGQIYELSDLEEIDDENIDVEDELDLEEEDFEATESAALDIDIDDEDDEDDEVREQLEALLEDADPLPRESTASSELVLGDGNDEPVITNSRPVIRGRTTPNTEIKISVHSETGYETTTTTNPDGSFELDLDALGLDLEPGEHTVTYSYIDPDTGEEVEVTETFFVEDESMLLAQADTNNAQTTTTQTTTNHGTGSPYPMNTPTPIPTTPPPAIATDSTAATRTQPVSTDGALAKAGSIGATLLVALTGIFLIISGSWSWWLAAELSQDD